MTWLRVIALAGCASLFAACGDGTTSPDGGTGIDAGPHADLGGGDAGGGSDAGPVCRMDVDCNDGLYCTGTESCAPANPHADARGCFTAGSPCLASQTCNETMRRCVAMGCTTPDADGDGHASTDCGGDDCDDADPNRYPGNTEVCDTSTHDEDCDTATFGFRDGDSDSHGDATCCNTDGVTMHCGDDCDDSNPSIHPTAPEVCNTVDDNCDGNTDEGVLVTYYVDCDMDLHGEHPTDSGLCGTPATTTGCTPPPGYVANHDDCDDSPPPGPGQAQHPGNTEFCDGLDNDCNGIADDALPAHRLCPDGDGDGYVVDACITDCAGRAGYVDVTIDTAHDPALHPTKVDCNDSDARVHPDATDACGMDLDCIPGGGGAGSVTWYLDCDGDGHATATAMSMTSCTMPAAPAPALCVPPPGSCMPMPAPTWTSMIPNMSNADCNDFQPTVFTGSSWGPCDGFDSNCDGALETGDDPDGDGSPSCACNVDCAPADGSVHPGATEIPGDGIDQSCDLHEDCYVDGDGDGDRSTATTATTDVACSGAGHARSSAAVDCCDTDPGANHTIRFGATMPDACGSYDWDCDGVARQVSTQLAMGACHVTCTMCMTPDCVPSFPASFRMGWASGAVPACGVSADYVVGCAFGGATGACNRDIVTRTQSCI